MAEEPNQDNEWDGHAVLRDAREASTDLTTLEASDIVGHMQEISDGRRRGPVAVVATDDRILAAGQAYGDLVNRAGGRMALFSDIAEASAWSS